MGGGGGEKNGQNFDFFLLLQTTLGKFCKLESRRNVFAVKQPVMVNGEQEGLEKWKNHGAINPPSPERGR